MLRNRESINGKKGFNQFLCALFFGIIFAISPLYASPSAETGDVFSTTWSAVVLEGKVDTDSFPVAAWFEYGTETGSYSDTSLSYQINKESDTEVRICINKLSPDTKYYYRIVAENDVGIVYGEEKSFSTSFDGSPNEVTRATTGTATAVTYESAVLNGVVSLDLILPEAGWADLTTYFFAYGTASGGYTHTTYAGSESKPSNEPVSALLEGLSPSTSYYYQLVAQSDAGEAYGDEESFTTLAADQAPSVETSSAGDTTTHSAVLNGTVNAKGLSTNVWFEYGTESGSYEKSSLLHHLSSSDDTSVNVSVSDLSADTSYYYRIVAQNSEGISYGEEKTFATELYVFPCIEPEATTSNATNVSSSFATLNGAVADECDATSAYYFKYGTSTGQYSHISLTGNITGSSDSLSAEVSGLLPETKYYFIMVIDSDSSSRSETGEEKSFTTLAADQLEAEFGADETEVGVCTEASVQFTDKSAGNPTTWYWDFGNGTTSNEQNPVATYSYSDAAGNSGACFSVSLTVSNNEGTDTVTKECYITLIELVGDVFEAPPEATTGSATDITASTATLNGTVIGAGGDTKTWFVYYTVDFYDVFIETVEAEETGSAAVSAQIEGLLPETTYFYRILSQNYDDPDDCIYVWDTTTVEGDEVSFTTKSASDATGRIYGTVIDAGGSPVETARVICKGKKAKEEVATDVEGYFEFDELGKGTYKITVSKKGYKKSKQKVKLGKGEEEKLDITLKKK